MARKFWPNHDPIGKRYTRDRDRPQWIEVIGVVADTREFGLESPAIPQTFVMQRAIYKSVKPVSIGLALLILTDKRLHNGRTAGRPV